MTMEDWLTLEGAARHLGVSTRTLRRWIKAGKLEAELRPGPYGHQYLVPTSSVAGREVIRDLARVEREEERETVPRIVEEHLAARESALVGEVAALRRDLVDVLLRLEERLERIERELAALRSGADERDQQ
jgi:excisionase family DNA binding protein